MARDRQVSQRRIRRECRNPGSGQAYEPRTVSLPKAQLEDLNMIRNEWGKIVRDMGMSIRPSFRET